MTNNTYFIRKQQLASVFEDTMLRIKQSADLKSAIDYSIHNQQFIPESATISVSDVQKADKPANTIVSRPAFFWSRRIKKMLEASEKCGWGFSYELYYYLEKYSS